MASFLKLKTIVVNEEENSTYEMPLLNNFRPIQPLNGRRIVKNSIPIAEKTIHWKHINQNLPAYTHDHRSEANSIKNFNLLNFIVPLLLPFIVFLF